MTHRYDPFRYYHSGPEWIWERWQWRGTLHSPKLQHYWILTIRLFSVISRTLVGGGGGGVLTLCREAVNVFDSPQPTGQWGDIAYHLILLGDDSFVFSPEPVTMFSDYEFNLCIRQSSISFWIGCVQSAKTNNILCNKNVSFVIISPIETSSRTKYMWLYFLFSAYSFKKRFCAFGKIQEK